MIRILIRYIKFIGTSIAGTGVDMLVLWILSDHVLNRNYRGEYIISPIISFQCAVAVNFVISYFYVWKDRTRSFPNAGFRRFARLYIRYNLSCSTIFLLRLGIIQLIGRFTGWDVLICNLMAMCLSGLLNFTVSNLLIFRKKA